MEQHKRLLELLSKHPEIKEKNIIALVPCATEVSCAIFYHGLDELLTIMDTFVPYRVVMTHEEQLARAALVNELGISKLNEYAQFAIVTYHSLAKLLATGRAHTSYYESSSIVDDFWEPFIAHLVDFVDDSMKRVALPSSSLIVPRYRGFFCLSDLCFGLSVMPVHQTDHIMSEGVALGFLLFTTSILTWQKKGAESNGRWLRNYVMYLSKMCASNLPSSADIRLREEAYMVLYHYDRDIEKLHIPSPIHSLCEVLLKVGTRSDAQLAKQHHTFMTLVDEKEVEINKLQEKLDKESNEYKQLYAKFLDNNFDLDFIHKRFSTLKEEYETEQFRYSELEKLLHDMEKELTKAKDKIALQDRRDALLELLQEKKENGIPNLEEDILLAAVDHPNVEVKITYQDGHNIDQLRNKIKQLEEELAYYTCHLIAPVDDDRWDSCGSIPWPEGEDDGLYACARQIGSKNCSCGTCV